MSEEIQKLIEWLIKNKETIIPIVVGLSGIVMTLLINYAKSLVLLDPFSFTFEYYDKRVLTMFVRLGKAAFICLLLFLGFTFPIAVIKYFNSNIIQKTDLLVFSGILFVWYILLKFRCCQTLLAKIDKSIEVDDYEILRTIFISLSALSFMAIILSYNYYILVAITIIILSSLYVGSVVFKKNYEKINYSYFYMFLQEHSEKIFIFGKINDKLLCGFKDYKKCNYDEIKLFSKKIKECRNKVNESQTLKNFTDIKNKILKYIDELSYYGDLIRLNEDCVDSIFSIIYSYLYCNDFSNILLNMQFENDIEEKMKDISKKVSFKLINLETVFDNQIYTNANNINRFSKYNL